MTEEAASMINKVPIEETVGPVNIATISAGFEKGDFLVREEQGNRVYFDFFEGEKEKGKGNDFIF